jgi:uridine phosphorylase
MSISESELILNPDNSIYHLHLQPEHIAKTIILVGDPNRVGEVSKHFDKIEHQISNREFVTHTGQLRGERLTVISTGIGTDNIDIVLNELDALVNIDFKTREIKSELTSLDFIRIGTSGSLQQNIDIDSFVVSTMAVGMDNLMQYYDAQLRGDEMMLSDAIADYLEQRSADLIVMPYAFSADKDLLAKFDTTDIIQGITVTTSGFYAPQGRKLRGRTTEPNLLKILSSFKNKNKVLTNFEMETAGIYGISRLLGHRAVSFSAILANRLNNTFSQQPQKTVESLIAKILNILAV